MFVMSKCYKSLLLLVCLVALPIVAAADTAFAGQKQKWRAAAVIERGVRSHTSYEFGNPFEPYQAPLSRLEFPLNTWWGGVELRRDFSRGSLGGLLLTNLTQNTDGFMQDWDWENEDAPSQATTYSASRCRVEPSFQARFDFDLKVSDWLGLPVGIDIRPVVGFQWQRFNFMAHDGNQWSYFPPEPPMELVGNSIHFRQDYQLYFLGVKASYAWKNAADALPATLFLFCWWAYAKADNEDHHMLHPGFRLTLEKSTGSAWFFSGGTRAHLSRNVSAVLEASYLTIRTTGTHRLVNEPFTTDFRFDHGVKVWSEQATLAVRLEYAF
jgi:outer membrane protease